MRNFIQNLKSLNSLKNLMQIFKSMIPSFCPRFALVSILSRICVVSLILMMGTVNVWGEEYAYQHDEQLGANADKTNSVTFTTPTFTNTTGIDHISFGYNSQTDGIIIEYSLDGSNYAEWSRTNVGEGSISDDIPFDHPARNAVSFRLKANGKKGWHGVWNMRIRRANDVIFRSSSYSSGSKPFQITQDSVVFNLNIDNYYNSGNGHFYVHTTNTTASITWEPKSGYTIAVTGVTLNGQNAQESHYYDWLIRTCTGLSYIRSHTASDNTEQKISQNNSNATYTYTTANNTNVFPSGAALVNSAYFKLRAEKGYKDADGESSYEYQIKFAALRYTITPPAPTLTNGSSVTRSQFIEGRSNNTVTLTDFFAPFNSGVAMTYVVKKKNGSGVYETIAEGFDITSNVFKTTVVGEYQIIATSNATGAFTASGNSEPLNVTVEEVRPVTVTVGSQELYVEETTSMRITEQLNTTKDVVFIYDKNFFEYDEENEELTVKNDGNESFVEREDSIRVTQVSDGVYAAVDYKIPFVIKKRPNTIYAAGSTDYSSTMYMNASHDSIQFTATNTVYTGERGSGITVRQLNMLNDSVTYVYNAATRKICVKSHHYVGTVQFEISQPVNYKYLAAKDTFSIAIGLVPEVMDCYVLNDDTQHSFTTGIEFGHFSSDDEYALSGPADKLYFKAKADGANYFAAQYSTDNGSNWADICMPDLTNNYPDSDYGPYTIPASNATHIRFGAKSGATGSKWWKDVKVTRKTFLKTDADTIRISKTAGNNAIYPSSGVGVGKLVIDYSLANGGDLHIANDNAKFTLSSTTIDVSDCSNDTSHIHLGYSSAVAGNDTAHLVIYNAAYRKEVVLIGTTIKHNQDAGWKSNISVLKRGTKVAEAFSSTLSGEGDGVIYSVITGSAITIKDPDTLVASAVGTSQVRAFVEGDALYYDAVDTIEIEVTDNDIQYIVWDQNLRGLKTGDANVTLTASAQSDIDCSTNGSRTISYSIEGGGTSVVEIVNTNELKINGVGRAWVIASVAANDKPDADGHSYMAAEARKEVIVRDPSAVCGEYYLYNMNDSTQWVGSSDKGVRAETVESTSEKISFEGKDDKTRETNSFVHSPSYAVWYAKRDGGGKGTLKIQQYVLGGWSDAKSISSFETSWTPDTIALNANATKVRYVLDQTSSNLYVGGLKVVIAPFIKMAEDNVVTETIVFSGNIGASVYKDLQIRKYTRKDVTLTLPAGAPFTLSENIFVTGCEVDTVDLRITFNTNIVQTDSCYDLVISDGETTKTIVLKATATAKEVTYSGDGDWTDSNWDVTPNKNCAAVIGEGANVTIRSQVSVYSLTIEEGASVTIAPTGGLTVGAGSVSGAVNGNLVLKAATNTEDSTGQTGYLRISPLYTDTMPIATVELFSTAIHSSAAASGSKTKWQCVGAPISDEGVDIKTVYPAGTWVYSYNEASNSWVNERTTGKFVPFKGYKTSQKLDGNGKRYENRGHIVSGRPLYTIELDSTAELDGGYNLLANSFTAPIAISQFNDTDFVDADTAIYILNAGTTNQSNSPGNDVDAPGKWVSIPINTASELASAGLPRMIPSMQGFWVRARSNDAQLKLDYSRLVWGVSYSGDQINKPLRAPKRTTTEENKQVIVTGKMKISLSAEEGNDHLYLLESEAYDAAYEGGYDAYKLSSGGAEIFALTDNKEELYVDATNSLIGTQIGVRTGEMTEYTLRFSRVESENGLALYDAEAYTTTNIDEGTEYTFYAASNDTITTRFSIVERANSPAVATGVDGIGSETKVQKFIKDGHLYVLKNGVLYNAQGMMIERQR